MCQAYEAERNFIFAIERREGLRVLESQGYNEALRGMPVAGNPEYVTYMRREEQETHYWYGPRIKAWRDGWHRGSMERGLKAMEVANGS